jgi:uncharacterized membrane protein
MKYVISLVVIVSLGAILYGFSIQDEELSLAHKFIGFGTAGLFLVAMPLFLYKESKGKKMNDYMLTEENIRKMRGEERKKPENQ